jgi:hypothetical protein
MLLWLSNGLCALSDWNETFYGTDVSETGYVYLKSENS